MDADELGLTIRTLVSDIFLSGSPRRARGFMSWHLNQSESQDYLRVIRAVIGIAKITRLRPASGERSRPSICSPANLSSDWAFGRMHHSLSFDSLDGALQLNNQTVLYNMSNPFHFDLVIKNGTVVTASVSQSLYSTLEKRHLTLQDDTECDIGVKDGVVTCLGKNLPIPEGCKVIDAEGGYITVCNGSTPLGIPPYI
jgi:hypothetical protein